MRHATRRSQKQKIAFGGKIKQSALTFKSGTPNVHTVNPPSNSTSASTAAVSTSTAQLVARQQSLFVDAGVWKPAVKSASTNDDGRISTGRNKQRKKGKRGRSVKSIPDFFTPEKGVLLLGTLRPNGVPTSMDTSPTTTNLRGGAPPHAPHATVQMAKETPRDSSPSIVLSWQPLGSPVRRMQRAMRFVQQNTCVTQRVTVDVGGVARLVIPCFEGITTVSDLIETVRCRFPQYEITGLRQPGTNIGRHAWDTDSTSYKDQMDQKERYDRKDSSTTDENHTVFYSTTASHLLNPNDFVSVAVGSDAALVAEGVHLPRGGDLIDENDEIKSVIVSPITARNLSPANNNNGTAKTAIEGMVKNTFGTPRKNSTATATTTDPASPYHEYIPAPATETDVVVSRSTTTTTPPQGNFRQGYDVSEDAGDTAAATPTTPLSQSTRRGGDGADRTPLTAQEMARKKAGSAMAMAVRDRLMLRIQSLAEKGAISASQRGYLDQLVRTPGPNTTNNTDSDIVCRATADDDDVTLLPQDGVRVEEAPPMAYVPMNLRDDVVIASNDSHSSSRNGERRKHKHRHRKTIDAKKTTSKLETIAGSMYTPAPPGSSH